VRDCAPEEKKEIPPLRRPIITSRMKETIGLLRSEWQFCEFVAPHGAGCHTGVEDGLLYSYGPTKGGLSRAAFVMSFL
jgi:hypothetical protein